MEALAAFELEQGRRMIAWMRDLWSFPRTLTGEGVRQTLSFIQNQIPELQRHQVPSGTEVFDWTVPNEWTLHEAQLVGPGGVVVDAGDNLLHVLIHSEAVDRKLSLAELQPFLYSLPERPDAIPYVTSYYRSTWGFCLPHRQREALPEGEYHALIRAEHRPGQMDYADLVIPGESPDEIVFSTYICHPNLANNELSGPVMAMALAQYVASLPKRRWTYRFIFVPETIGAVTYLAKNLEHMKRHTRAGFILTCVGDERAYSFMPSRWGDTLADRVVGHVILHHAPETVRYSFLQRGSDERQYCSPGADLPFCSLMRSKYGVYPEYHTSDDNFDVVTERGLAGAFDKHRKIISILEANAFYRTTVVGEPQLGKRGLYPQTSTPGAGLAARDLVNLLAHADGSQDLIGICDTIGLDAMKALEMVGTLIHHGLFEEVLA